MKAQVDFLLINSVQPLDDLFDYTKNIINELLKKKLITQLTISQATLEFANSSPVTEISDNIFITNYLYNTNNHNTHWRLEFEYGTFTSSNQLQVKVFSEYYDIRIEDNYLEQLKHAIKNIVKSDWEKIVWLMDKDSEMLSISLYPSIYRVENLARQLINEIMTKEYGIGWWDLYVPLYIRNKHLARMSGYKAIAPSFANVDERLMSIDIGDLIKIFTLTQNKWNPVFNAEISSYLSGHLDIKPNKIKDILSSQMIVTKDLWEEQFSKYLSRDFISKLKEFDLNRNHVAHNKLIDRAAYVQIQKSIEAVEHELTTALIKVTEIVISKEQREAIEQQIEIEKQEMQDTLLNIMESEAGVTIRTYDEIIDLYDEHLYEFHSELQSYMRFRNDIEIGDYQSILSENYSGKLFEITYRINGSIASVNYSIDSINNSQGEESTVEISIQINDDMYSKVIRYINGEVSFNEYQGNYMPETQDTFYIVDLKELLEELVEFLDMHFENMREKVDLDHYKVVKKGGNSPVAEGVNCCECGEEYVSIDEAYGDYGRCLNCGEMNEVSVCARCGCHFEGIPSDDEPDFCDNCIDYFKSQ